MQSRLASLTLAAGMLSIVLVAPTAAATAETPPDPSKTVATSAAGLSSPFDIELLEAFYSIMTPVPAAAGNGPGPQFLGNNCAVGEPNCEIWPPNCSCSCLANCNDAYEACCNACPPGPSYCLLECRYQNSCCADTCCGYGCAPPPF